MNGRAAKRIIPEWLAPIHRWTGPMWCTNCGRHLQYQFLPDAWCCPDGCARIGNEALWRINRLLARQ